MNLKSYVISLCLCAGFFVSAQSGITIFDSIQSGGLWRSYRLYVPATYTPSKPAPLVLNLHGFGSSALEQQYYSNFMPIADTAGFLILMPNGTVLSGSRFWNVGVVASPNDLSFISELIDSVKTQYQIDQSAMYSTGMSNGGIMSYYLACSLPNKFAAIASVAGSMFRSWFNTCQPLKAVPVMEIHGTLDGTVPYLGTAVGALGSFTPIDSVILKWRLHDNCQTTPQVINYPDINLTDLSTATNYRYLQGRENSSVELIKVIGGGHAWPGSLPVLSLTNLDFSASKEIWRFFRPYRLNQFTSTTALAELQLREQVHVYPNPTSTYLNIDAPEDALIQVLDAQGRVIASGAAARLDLSEFAQGLYVLRVQQGAVSTAIKFQKQ